MNKVFLTGRICNDVELTKTSKDLSICKVSLAVKRNYGDETDFFNCTAFKNQAELIAKYSKKGDKITFIGSIQMQKYTDKDDIERTGVNIVVNEVELLENKHSDSEQQASKPQESKPQPKKKPMLEAYDESGDDNPFN